MKENYTHITVLLDRSGSMEEIKYDTIGGFNQFVKEQTEVPGYCTMSLHQFDDRYQTDYAFLDIQNVPALNKDSFKPRGWTAYYDAAIRAINELGRDLSDLPEADRPSKVIFVILTDGMDNRSKAISCYLLRELITLQRDTYKWEFLFLGANFDALKEAQKIGIDRRHALSYAATSQGIRGATQTISQNMVNYRTGATADPGFTEQQFQQGLQED